MNDSAPPQFDGTMETRPTWLQKKSHSGKVDMTSADFEGGSGRSPGTEDVSFECTTQRRKTYLQNPMIRGASGR